MNEIELNAMVALEHLADAIFFIIDASETCGYPIESQYKLSEEIKRIFDVPMVYLFNKMDISNVNKEIAENSEDISYLNEYINKIDDYLLISASEGKGIEEIIAKLETVKKIEKETESNEEIEEGIEEEIYD
jgi:nucleolar GTP-binding protein